MNLGDDGKTEKFVLTLARPSPIGWERVVEDRVRVYFVF
jgi:hypothetical protein